MDKAELITKDQIRTDLPEIKSGMKVKVYEKIKEGDKQRIAQFSGIVIATKHGSKTVNGTFTVRAVLDGVGVEKTWPIYSPSIEKIEVLDVLKTRRSKLYYIRNLSPKKLRKKLRPLKEFIGLKEKKASKVEQEIKKEQEAAKQAQEDKAEENRQPEPQKQEDTNKEQNTENSEKSEKSENSEKEKELENKEAQPEVEEAKELENKESEAKQEQDSSQEKNQQEKEADK